MEEEFNAIFTRWVKFFEDSKSLEYTPPGTTSTAPIYTPTPTTAGPKAITIEEYRRRQKTKKPRTEEAPTGAKQITKSKKKRAGKQYQARKTLAILYEKLNIATSVTERKVIKNQIKAFRENRI